jgi:DNA polymerase II small subunit/DNA polymerase delta subunit B
MRSSLLKFFSGELTSNSIINQIKCLVICGNLIHPHSEIEQYDRLSYIKSDLNKNIQEYTMKNLNEANIFIKQLIKIVPVYLLPGNDDVTSGTYPQEPIKPFIFDDSNSLNSFNLVSNPCSIFADKIEVFVSSGQNIQEMKKYCNKDSLACINTVLQSGHYSPIYPDLQRYSFKSYIIYFIKF